MYSATLNQIWKRYDGEPVNFRGVDCCVYVDEFGEGEIAVELIPEDENEGDEWPVDVLALPAEVQEKILGDIRSGLEQG